MTDSPGKGRAGGRVSSQVPSRSWQAPSQQLKHGARGTVTCGGGAAPVSARCSCLSPQQGPAGCGQTRPGRTRHTPISSHAEEKPGIW